MKYLYMISVLWYIAIGIALAGEWNEKPVMCEQKQVALDAVRAKGEIPMITGVQSAKVRAEQGVSTG